MTIFSATKTLPTLLVATLLAAVPAFGAATPTAAPNPSTPLVATGPAGIASHIKVLSDKVEDVSSLAAWKKSFIRPGMTEQQKALVVWTTVVKFRQQANPPYEYIESDGHVHDPIKNFNVYGYGQCCCASADVESLARYAGLQARGWGITNHSVPEIKVNGNWGMFDGSLVNYFLKPGGAVAGVEEINKSIRDWEAQHPDFKSSKKAQFMADGGWHNGPPILADSVSYDNNGWLPAHTHAWSDSMSEFGGKHNFIFDYASAVGYQVNIQLRPGEKLIRNWSNKGLDVNEMENHHPAAIDSDSPDNPGGDLAYARKYGDLTHGRVGSGTHDYTPPLASLKDNALTFDNLAVDGKDLRVADGSKPATLVIPMHSSYVFLSGTLAFTPAVGNGGSVDVSFSDNNGLDWKPVASVTAASPQTIDLKSLVYRHYNYRLKFDFKGAGTGLDALHISHDIQCSQRALPILGDGKNTITFSEEPQEGTIVIEGMTDASGNGPKTLLLDNFHPTFDHVNKSFGLTAGTGTVTFPVKTPGDMTRLRIGIAYRARDAKDTWTIQASFDGGKTFKDIDTLKGPFTGNSAYVVFSDIPPKTRSAQVRFAGTQRNTTKLMDLRIAADYHEPDGGFVPIKITYAYEENGKPKTDTHIARKPDETYTIDCTDKPTMKSITLQLAQ